MEISNKLLIESSNALKEITTFSLPIKTSFKIAKIVRQVQPTIDAYEEVLKNLQEKYAEKDEEGKPRVNDTDNPGIKQILLSDAEKFSKEYQELLDAINEITIEKLTIEDFGEAEIKPNLLVQLSWLIEGLE